MQGIMFISSTSFVGLSVSKASANSRTLSETTSEWFDLLLTTDVTYVYILDSKPQMKRPNFRPRHILTN